MTDLSPVGAIPPRPSSTGPTNATQSTASSAFGVGFEDLLRIVLTQLTYQDPLKPMESFEFVSQLAQFSQIQQTQTMSDRLDGILRAETTGQAAALLGRKVEIQTGNSTVTGKVTAVNFQSGAASLTLLTPTNQTISNIDLAAIIRISPGD
jgi:flagellar basal-body rod modification protein FlgD